MGIFLAEDTLAVVVSDLKSRGKRVVFTNGCFDILHAGHVRYLKQARTLGDVLVVALNTDASVARLKPFRPIVEEMLRAEVVAALECVDFVTLFSEDTPYELIKKIVPDVVVKGGDWQIKDIVGADIVAEAYSINYYEGLSTSGIISKIKHLYCNK